MTVDDHSRAYLVDLHAVAVAQSRSRFFAQGVKWNFCLTAGKICPRIRRDHEEESAPESLPGFQSEGGTRCYQGRSDTFSAIGAVWRSCEPDRDLEGATSRRRRGCLRASGRREAVCAAGGHQGAARQDRRADARERFFRVPDRGSVNPTPFRRHGIARRRLAHEEFWMRLRYELTKSGYRLRTRRAYPSG